MRTSITPFLLASLAAVSLVGAVRAESYFFRWKPTVRDAQTFGFQSAEGAEPGEWIRSNATPVKGHGGKTVEIVGGEYQICGPSACSDQAPWRTVPTSGVADAFNLRVRVAAPAFNQTSVATLTVGDASATFAVTSRGRDGSPATVTFPDRVDQVPGDAVVSEIRQLRDHDGVAVSVRGEGSEYRVCADATCSSAPLFTTAPGTAARDAFVQVRQSAPASGQPARVATLVYGTETATFSVRSVALVANQCGSRPQRHSGRYQTGWLEAIPVGTEFCVGNAMNPSPADNFAVAVKSGPSSYRLIGTESRLGGRRLFAAVDMTYDNRGLFTETACQQIPETAKAWMNDFPVSEIPICYRGDATTRFFLILRDTHDAVVTDDGRLLSLFTNSETLRW